MQIRKAERKKAKLRLGISAPSGAGKTYSSLNIAYGITGDWSKVGMIDTENGSGDLYAHLGDYSVIPIEAPFTPDKYIQAIKLFEDNGFDVIIIDSLSHAWAGEGGILDIQSAAAAASRSGNSYTAWREVTPKHNALVNTILQSKCHIICTMRAKTEYVQEKNDNGKTEIRKVGLAPIQRDGMEYEFTVMLDVALNHSASASKDRTGLFDGQYFKPGMDTGKKLLEWLETGAEVVKSDTLQVIKEKWEQLGFKEASMDAQLMKTYGSNQRNLTETSAQDFIAKLDGLLQTKLAESQQSATNEEEQSA
ncbi:ATP-binding protein [Paenibacillus sp. HJGM_3]|uniref:ATP-binding protein n=1 Tax=Paenibacillus sp. HJGM_3 TaxID=3379816 RepID=UPI00385C8AB9